MNKQSIILPWIAIAFSIAAGIITFLDLDKAQITDDSFIGITLDLHPRITDKIERINL